MIIMPKAILKIRLLDDDNTVYIDIDQLEIIKYDTETSSIIGLKIRTPINS